MNTLTINNTALDLTEVNGVMTMSSLQLAKLCVGDAADAHTDFMTKAKKVLKKDIGNFSDIYLDSMNRKQKCLALPEREACLMAMSYSYELQAQVYDAWQSLAKQSQVQLPDFNNPVEAARAWADTQEEVESHKQLTNEASRQVQGLLNKATDAVTITVLANGLNEMLSSSPQYEGIIIRPKDMNKILFDAGYQRRLEGSHIELLDKGKRYGHTAQRSPTVTSWKWSLELLNDEDFREALLPILGLIKYERCN